MIIAVEQCMRYIELLPLNEHYLCKSLIFLSDIKPFPATIQHVYVHVRLLQWNDIVMYMIY